MNKLKRKIKSRRWQIHKSKKEILRRTKLNKKYKRRLQRESFLREIGYDISLRNNHLITFSYTCPQNFSIEKNTEETIEFFNNILSRIKRTYEWKKKIRFFFVFDDVINVDADALMYLIAIMKDLHSDILKKYQFAGSFPRDRVLRNIFSESGFLEYVESNEPTIIPKSNRIKIRTGKNNEPCIARDVCLFTQKITKLERIHTIPLYNILIELMGNTKNHAYHVDSHTTGFSANSWYLYAEERENDIRFVFLDTGLGIPKTVYRNWHEKIPLVNKDADFICSALRGDFRSNTRLTNRSKGLPQIAYECSKGFIENAGIYSGKGCCKIKKEKNNKYETIDLKNSINGTLFSWHIKKGGDYYDIY